MYGLVLMVVALALGSLALDYGRAQYVRMELQSGADGAARAAASGIPTSLAEARTRGRAVGNLNKANGAAVTFADGDFHFGKWNATTNTIDAASASEIDAVEVTARRSVPLVFGAFFGKGASDIAARATGKVTRGGITGFIGLNNIDGKNSVFLGGYTATAGTVPSTGNATGSGTFGTNGTLSVGNGSDVNGYVLLGPTGTYTPTDPPSTRLTTPIAAPTVPAMPSGANPGGVSHALSVAKNTTTTRGPGTYWFSSLSIAGTLTFSGEATVFIDGNVDLMGDFRAYQDLPSNLKVYVVGNNRTFGDANANGNSQTFTLAAVILAPGADLIMKNNFKFSGSGLFKSISTKNKAEFFYDLGLGDPSGANGVTTVK